MTLFMYRVGIAIKKHHEDHVFHGLASASFSTKAKNVMALQYFSTLYKQFRQETDARSGLPSHEDVARRLQQLIGYSCPFFQATVSHDIIYALLGLLCVDEIPIQLYPDYESPLGLVFHRCTEYIIEHTRSLGFFPCYNWRLQDTPNWVPDWRYGVKSPGESKKYEEPSLAHIMVSVDGSQLEVDGVKLGAVAAVISHEITTDDSLAEVEGLRQFRELRQACLHRVQALQSDCSERDFSKRWRDLVPHSYDSCDESALEAMEGIRNDEDEDDPVYLSRKVHLRQRYEECLSDRHIGILDNGHLLLLFRDDEQCVEGDLACLLSGFGQGRFKQPCIIRPFGDSTYISMGHCQSLSLKPEALRDNPLNGKERFVLV